MEFLQATSLRLKGEIETVEDRGRSDPEGVVGETGVLLGVCFFFFDFLE